MSASDGSLRCTGTPESHWRLRLDVRLDRRLLDHQLSDGAGVDASPALALRADQLSRPTERRAIAASLRNVLDAAEECEAGLAPRLHIDHSSVVAARRQIAAVIELLRSAAELEVRGIALARLLAEDPASPLLHPAPATSLRESLATVLAAL